MGNLGWYQLIVTLAKKVGGPKVLMGIVFGGGAAAGGGIVYGAGRIKKRRQGKKKKERTAELSKTVYTVIDEGRSNEGLLFEKGDTFRVLEIDGDAVLIEKIGDKNSPYFVSQKFLRLISDYH